MFSFNSHLNPPYLLQKDWEVKWPAQGVTGRSGRAGVQTQVFYVRIQCLSAIPNAEFWDWLKIRNSWSNYNSMCCVYEIMSIAPKTVVFYQLYCSGPRLFRFFNVCMFDEVVQLFCSKVFFWLRAEIYIIKMPKNGGKWGNYVFLEY